MRQCTIFFARRAFAAHANNAPLSLRLSTNPNATELHSLRWETLRLPNSDGPLLTSEHLLFSRYLSGRDLRLVPAHWHADLSAIVAIASPSNTTKWRLCEVAIDDELDAAHEALGIISNKLPSPGTATINNLAACLRDGCDILYLVAHGILVDGQPQVLLEQEDGTGQWVPGQELVTRIYELQDRPRLVVRFLARAQGLVPSQPRRTMAPWQASARVWPRQACRP